MKKKILVMIAGLFVIVLFAFVPKSTPQDPWKVPDSYKTKANPTKADVASTLATGKTLYNTHCKSLHVTKDKGDEPRAGK